MIWVGGQFTFVIPSTPPPSHLTISYTRWQRSGNKATWLWASSLCSVLTGCLVSHFRQTISETAWRSISCVKSFSLWHSRQGYTLPQHGDWTETKRQYIWLVYLCKLGGDMGMPLVIDIVHMLHCTGTALVSILGSCEHFVSDRTLSTIRCGAGPVKFPQRRWEMSGALSNSLKEGGRWLDQW